MSVVPSIFAALCRSRPAFRKDPDTLAESIADSAIAIPIAFAAAAAARKPNPGQNERLAVIGS